LRAGEVVALNLEDLDWAEGLIRIRRKGARWSDYQKAVDLCTTFPGPAYAWNTMRVPASASVEKSGTVAYGYDATSAKLRGQARIAKILTCRHSFAG